MEYVAYDAALTKLRAAQQERDAALDREALARDELAEVHRVADSFLADEREERAMAEAELRDQLEQARGIAVALEARLARVVALTEPYEALCDTCGTDGSSCHQYEVTCLAAQVRLAADMPDTWDYTDGAAS